MIIIRQKSQQTEFQKVKIGNAFLFGNQYYMKSDPGPQQDKGRAVDLETGCWTPMNPTVLVEVVDATVTIS